jgi:hypothetical protein
MFKYLAAAAVIAAASPAFAAVTAFTDRGSFNAAAGALATETFNSVVADRSFNNKTIAFQGFTVRGDDPLGQAGGNNYIDVTPLNNALSPPNFSVDGTTLLNAVVFPNSTSVTFTFSRAITAVGFDTRRMQNLPTLMQISVGGETFIPGVLPLFLGYVSDTPFTTLTFSGQAGAEFGDSFSIDNFSFSANAVPEPASWAMLIAGFGLVGAAARRRRTAVAA